MESKEVAKQESSTEVTQYDPNVVYGMEGADMEGITYPRVKVAQPTSPELTADDSTLRMGDVFNNLTNEKLESYSFTPVFVWDSNALFVPRDGKDEDKARLMAQPYGLTDDDFQASNILCRSKDGKCGDRFGICKNCPLNKFDNISGTKPLCNATVNVLALFDGIDLPLIVQFAQTSKKHGDRFKQMLMFSGGAIFKKKYKLQPVKKTKPGQTWFELTAVPGGLTAEDEFAKAKMFYELTLKDRSFMETSSEIAPEVHEDTNKEY